YWALHRPSLLPSGAVFLIGLLQDFLSGGPIGQNAAILILIYVVAVSQARFFYGKSFFVVWWGFMMVSLGVAAAEWLIACLLSGSLLAPEPALFECTMNIAAYPILGWLFVQVHRTLPREE
ncbi:MAG: rod shape-determining protein MreD, partial [Rickettsiales bacterium]